MANSEDKVIVDEDIYEELKGVRISLNGHYAQFWSKDNQKNYYLHRYVLGNPESEVDHINRNKLDCRRENLRLATRSQNNVNKGKRKGTSSKYIGVRWHKRDQKWEAYCSINGKNKNLGYYDDEDEAGKVRDRAVLELYGPFAVLNFPEEQYQFTLKYIPVFEPQTINNYYHCTIYQS